MTQFNIWDFALEDYYVENAAECRSDLLGSIMKWQENLWVPNDVGLSTATKFVCIPFFFLRLRL